MIDQTPSLEADTELSRLLRGTDQLLQRELQQYSRTAHAKWDLQRDPMDRPLLLLTVRDSFGFASDQFAPDEIQNHEHFRARLHRLVSDLLQSSRRISVSIQETTLTADQLEALRTAINCDETLVSARPRLQNQLRINADGSFTVRDFSIEVDADGDVIAAVRRAVTNAGLTPKGEALASKPAAVQAVRTLVDAHRQDPIHPPRLVLWFRLDDPKDVHLLELTDELADPGDGALDGVAVGAGGAVPGARSIVIYLAAPAEVHKAFEVNPGHPAIEAMVNRSGRVMYPPDDWPALIDEFPEIVQQPVP